MVAAVVVDAVVEKHEEDAVNTRISSQKVKRNDEKNVYTNILRAFSDVILQSYFNGYLKYTLISLSLFFFYG